MFKLFISSITPEAVKEYKRIFPDSELNVLLTFAGDKKKNLEIFRDLKAEGKVQSCILDSGAFTLNMTENKSSYSHVNFESFCAYAKRVQMHFDYMINFDSNFSSTGFNDNYKNLLKAKENYGVDLVPVVHDYKEEHGELDCYLNFNFPIIALGYHDKYKKKYFPGLAKKIREAGRKVHLLGLSDFKLLKETVLDFADTSNWAQASKFGYIYYFEDLKNHKQVTLRFQDVGFKERNSIIKFSEYQFKEKFLDFAFSTFGYKYEDLVGHRKDLCRQIVNIHFFLTAQEELRKVYALMEQKETDNKISENQEEESSPENPDDTNN